MFNINKSVESDYRAANRGSSRISNGMQISLLYALLLTIRDYLLHFVTFFFKKGTENIGGQLVLVTGGGNGLGRALSMRFAREGCNVAIADLDYKNAQKTAEEIREQFKVQCVAFHCDISDHATVLKLKSDIENEIGPVDILVNNAGLLYMSEFLLSDVSDIQRVIDVNLTSQIKMVHAFLPTMLEKRRGHIVSICSATALTPMPAAIVYTSTKWGLRGFMEGLLAEMLINDQEDLVKLTIVFPEFINTRKELSDVLDRMEFKLSRLTPERVADETVLGVLKGKKDVIVSDMQVGFQISRHLSTAGLKHVLKTSARVKKLFNSSH